jgi:hypothetical protein
MENDETFDAQGRCVKASGVPLGDVSADPGSIFEHSPPVKPTFTGS